MTTLAQLLERRRKLLERLEDNPGPNEREEIERLLEQIGTALDWLDRAAPGETSEER